MSDPVLWHRLQFAFTIVYHYLFPQLTMGLALLIVVLKWLGLRDDGWNDAARFWIRIFGINFAVGVVTGVPMEFQFGTNWAAFSRYAGGVIGQTLAMEGLFAFFLESSFLGLLVFGEQRLSRRGHFLAALSRCSSAAGCRATSSSARTRSCSIPSATPSAATAGCSWRTSPRSC